MRAWTHEPPGCWPTPLQATLLRATLGEGPSAVEAWERWRDRTDFENLDYESYRLLPLLHRNLLRLGVEHPWMGRMKGVHRRTWFANQLLFRDAAEVLRLLHAAGVKTMLLKGAAIAPTCYDDLGLRPMIDFDVLTPTEQAPLAFRTLLAAGWTSNADPDRLTSARRRRLHSVELRSPSKCEVDLHFQVLHRIQTTCGDDSFWAAAIPADLGGVETLALPPADQLLHVCVHGTTSLGRPRLLWAADACAILRSPAAIDWTRFVEQARRLRVVLAARQSLAWLDRTLAPSILADVHRTLAAERTTWADRRCYRHSTTAAEHLGPTIVLNNLFHHVVGSLADAGGPVGLRTMMSDYQRRHGLRAWHVPFHILNRWMRLVASRAFQKPQAPHDATSRLA